MVFPSLFRVNSAVPVALVFVGGTSSWPVSFVVNFPSTCAKAGFRNLIGCIVVVSIPTVRRLKDSITKVTNLMGLFIIFSDLSRFSFNDVGVELCYISVVLYNIWIN